ncbi:MAG: thioredoxin family protein [Sedimentisphaerales bacterium]|nr:thioredoxin family protein [Sedimentisphaerales bacterium]
MKSKKALLTNIFWVVYISLITCSASGQNANGPVSISSDSKRAIELARAGQEVSTVRIEPAKMDTKTVIAVIFEGTDDLHYYAKPETAPAEGLELKVQATSDEFEFGDVIFPKWHLITGPFDKKIEVYEGNFTVVIPIKEFKNPAKTVSSGGDLEVKISGIACTSKICLKPFEKTLRAGIDWSQRESWQTISFENEELDTENGPKKGITQDYSILFVLGLALLAGLSLNIMPCVWPVLPLIVMRIVEQARAGKKQSRAMGFAFCAGILIFFASLAIVNIVLQIFYDTVLQWGDQYRNPLFVAGMVILLVVLALLMFGVFNITVPSSIAGKSGSGKGYSGAIGTGFLAAILSTPCGFGILAFAFGWAQSQHWLISTIVIMFIGAGMAVPYAILTSMPGLLNRLPKPGQWMELFKQGVGFILLIIAVKLVGALPQAYRTNVLYFTVILGFGIWMWGGWISLNTESSRKWIIRIIAAIIVFVGGWIFLPTPTGELISWRDYDGTVIENALVQGKPVLIKFTADWCLSCQAIDKVVYHDEEIAKLIEEKSVLAIKADTTLDTNPATSALEEKYNEPGVPVTILFLPGTDEPVRLHEIFFKKKLKELLQRLPSK